MSLCVCSFVYSATGMVEWLTGKNAMDMYLSPALFIFFLGDLSSCCLDLGFGSQGWPVWLSNKQYPPTWPWTITNRYFNFPSVLILALVLACFWAWMQKGRTYLLSSPLPQILTVVFRILLLFFDALFLIYLNKTNLFHKEFFKSLLRQGIFKVWFFISHLSILPYSAFHTLGLLPFTFYSTVPSCHALAVLHTFPPRRPGLLLSMMVSAQLISPMDPLLPCGSKSEVLPQLSQYFYN